MLKSLISKCALILVIVLTLSLIGGCAAKETGADQSPAAPSESASSESASSESASSEAPPVSEAVPDAPASYSFGINTWGAGVPVLDTMRDEAAYSVSTIGCTAELASDDFTADKELANIQNFCSAGKDGICLQGAAVATVPKMSEICQSAQIPFVLFTFIGADEDRDKIKESNPFYVGAIDADMVTDGKLIAASAYEDGCRKAVLVGGNIGDNNVDQRMQGFTEEFEALGGTVLVEVRCTDASECPVKAEDTLSAYRDADCLYAIAGDYIPGSLSAINNLGMTDQMKVYMSCVDENSANYIKEGVVVEGNDGICLAASLAPTLLINYLDGHPILDENGKSPHLRTIPFSVTKDNADAYISVFYGEGSHPLTEDVLKSLCYRFNPDVTYETYIELINNGLTLNAILEAHGLPAID